MAAQPILVGDEIALNGERYPVVSADVWPIPSNAFARMMTQSLQTFRAPAVQDGKRGDAELNLSALRCTPLLPLDAVSGSLQLTNGMQAPHLLRQIFVEVNDGVVVSGYETATTTNVMMRLLVEDLEIGS